MNTDKVWFITGSNSGFGRSLTEAVLNKGYKVDVTLSTSFEDAKTTSLG